MDHETKPTHYEPLGLEPTPEGEGRGGEVIRSWIWVPILRLTGCPGGGGGGHDGVPDDSADRLAEVR